ncbi:MAG: hypothetical protein M3015_08675 [Bacteroidota bacterium]|nr:hypothetical protein [Bacteroidota bacterium]
MKATWLIAGGATAFLAYLFFRKLREVEGSSSVQSNPRHVEHHLTNVFANAKRHSAPKNL